VSHIRRGQEKSRPGALVFQLVSVVDWNQFVAHPMQDEGRAIYFVHPAQVVELLRQQEAQKANFTSGNAFN